MEATIKAIVETTEGVRLQASFGDETAQIYLCHGGDRHGPDAAPIYLLPSCALLVFDS